MTKAYIRKAHLNDIPELSENMRDADIAEVRAASGCCPKMATFVGIMAGNTSVICLPDDTPVGVFGVHPTHTEGLGVIWMLATKEFKQVHKQFLRECLGVIEEHCKPYKAVFNFTDARNTVHHRWIKWSGFTFIKRHEQFGFEKRPFLEFVRITEVHNV